MALLGVDMNIRKEIDSFAAKDDRLILHWLFNKYHMRSQWTFVATCTHERYGPLSRDGGSYVLVDGEVYYETNRIWAPTNEGRILYEKEQAND